MKKSEVRGQRSARLPSAEMKSGWYRNQTRQWNRLEKKGWKFSQAGVGIDISMAGHFRGEHIASIYISKEVPFRAIHTTLCNSFVGLDALMESAPSAKSAVENSASAPPCEKTPGAA